MNIHDRIEKRNRALNLFAAEEREQQLSAIALRQVQNQHSRLIPENKPTTGSHQNTPLGRLQEIDDTVQGYVLDCNQQLMTARLEANHAFSTDAELQRLYAAIDGSNNVISPLPIIEANIEADVQEMK